MTVAADQAGARHIANAYGLLEFSVAIRRKVTAASLTGCRRERLVPLVVENSAAKVGRALTGRPALLEAAQPVGHVLPPRGCPQIDRDESGGLEELE